MRPIPPRPARLAALALAFAAVPAGAQSLDFEHTGAGCAVALVPGGYGGLSWSNFYTLHSGFGAGWTPGTTSGACNAYNGNGNAASFSRAAAFDVESGWLTAGFSDGLQLRITGYRTGTASPVFDRVLTLSLTTPQLVALHFTNVNEVRFEGVRDRDTHFVLDDLTIAAASTVPEPSTWALVASGLAAVAAAARRRRR